MKLSYIQSAKCSAIAETQIQQSKNHWKTLKHLGIYTTLASSAAAGLYFFRHFNSQIETLPVSELPTFGVQEYFNKMQWVTFIVMTVLWTASALPQGRPSMPRFQIH